MIRAWGSVAIVEDVIHTYLQAICRRLALAQIVGSVQSPYLESFSVAVILVESLA